MLYPFSHRKGTVSLIFTLGYLKSILGHGKVVLSLGLLDTSAFMPDTFMRKVSNPLNVTVSQNKGQLSTHICQAHLGICIRSYICSHYWWSAGKWKCHMQTKYSGLDEDSWFVDNETVVGSLVIKTEETIEDL